MFGIKILAHLTILLLTSGFLWSTSNSMESNDQFSESLSQDKTQDLLTMNKRPSFFVGSRYGRSGPKAISPLLASLKTRRLSVVPRNDRFFLSSRYGKRSDADIPATATYEDTLPFTSYEQNALAMQLNANNQLSDKSKVDDNNKTPLSVMTCVYTGIINYYRCDRIHDDNDDTSTSGNYSFRFNGHDDIKN